MTFSLVKRGLSPGESGESEVVNIQEDTDVLAGDAEYLEAEQIGMPG
ncbi:hypothetical protein ACFWPH_20915 [Nocardia sp. NPDC058499]